MLNVAHGKKPRNLDREEVLMWIRKTEQATFEIGCRYFEGSRMGKDKKILLFMVEVALSRIKDIIYNDTGIVEPDFWFSMAGLKMESDSEVLQI